MSFIIRKATSQDSEQMGHVHYNAWIETYTGKINNNYLKELSVRKSVRMFQRIKCKNHLVLVIDDNIVGFIGFMKARDEDLNEDYGEIPGMYILKKYHGLGYGRELLTNAVTKLKEQGFKKIVLWVLDSNNNAISFYEKFGFVFEGKSKDEILVTPIRELRYIYRV
ncbi:GNAT family N-acetyltransferase [Mycoplasmatota bacterium]|nr:GNAT family N-acetyltransferase [Mycoplasmatota bacterium]